MSRPRISFTVPAWFDLKRYDSARNLDAADWFLNLEIRGEIQRSNSVNLTNRVRSTAPLIVRSIEDDLQRLVLCTSSESPYFMAMLNSQIPPSGIRDMRVDELYFFERWLDEDLRAIGATYDPDAPTSAPRRFHESVNNNLRKQLLGRFLRVDFTLPDKVLTKDFATYLRTERTRLKALKPDAPYIRALGSVGNTLKLRMLANYRVLPLIDVLQWVQDSGTKVTNAQLAELIDIDDDQIAPARQYAKVLLNQMTMHAWLLQRAREALSK